MSTRLNRHAASVVAALYQSAACVKARHASAWDVVLRNGAERPARVQLDDDWLQLDVELAAQDLQAAREEHPTSLWPLLQRNALLPPGLKLAVAVGDAVAPPVRLYAETMLDDAAEPAVRVRDLITAIQSAAHQWPPAGLAQNPAATAQTSFRRKPESSRDDLIIDFGDPHSLEPQHESPDLVAEINHLDPGFRQDDGVSATALAACRATDWPRTERDERIFFELDVRDDFAQAHVGVAAGGGINLVVDIRDDGVADKQRAALALLLLRATAHLRLVRAAAGTAARLEVALGEPVSTDALHAALSALSIAYRLVAREATGLTHDAALAAAYLRCGARDAGVSFSQP